jgi:hypothetical protein
MGITLAPMAEWRLYKMAHLRLRHQAFRKFRNRLLPELTFAISSD